MQVPETENRKLYAETILSQAQHRVQHNRWELSAFGLSLAFKFRLGLWVSVPLALLINRLQNEIQKINRVNPVSCSEKDRISSNF